MPISSVVVKSDTAAVKEIKVDDPEAEKSAPKSDKKFECVFVKVGNKAKIRVIKTGIQDDTNIEVLTGLKRRCYYYRALYNSFQRFKFGR